ncbi:MAG: nucleoside-diphosphate kinase [Actinomycetota bacterium]|nr:nucleoside-diphosphate kinase [Actinomycetota bacterium]
MAKPNAVARGLLGETISRLERKGLRLERIRMLHVDQQMAASLYAEHQGKPFYKDLVSFITSGPVVAMEWSGESAVAVVRAVMGATDPLQAPPGTIRGDYGLDIGENLVHGSDSSESARRELEIFFGQGEG